MHRRTLTLLEVAGRQHGLLARHQVVPPGADRRAWARLRTQGWWQQVSTRVVRHVGAPESLDQWLCAAALDAGPEAAIYGESSAARWGIAGFVNIIGERPHVIVPHGHGRDARPLGIVHTSVRLSRDHVRLVDGVPTTSVAQTLLDLARTCHPLKLERALDSALAMRIVSCQEVSDAIEEVTRSGRDGTVALRELVDARGRDYTPPASNIESRFAQIMRDAGEPELRRQVEVGGDQRWVGRVDFVDPDLPLIVEINSRLHHTALVDAAADAARYAALEAAGFLVVVVWDDEVWLRRDEVVARIRRGREELRRRLAA